MPTTAVTLREEEMALTPPPPTPPPEEVDSDDMVEAEDDVQQARPERRGRERPPGKPGMIAAAKAAARYPPSRPQDQIVYWYVKTLIEATKTLGFPVVLVFVLVFGGYLLFKDLGNRFLDSLERRDVASTNAVKELAEAVAESNELQRATLIELGIRPPPVRRKPTPTPAPAPRPRQ